MGGIEEDIASRIGCMVSIIRVIMCAGIIATGWLVCRGF